MERKKNGVVHDFCQKCGCLVHNFNMRNTLRVVKGTTPNWTPSNSSQVIEAGPLAADSFRFYQWIKGQKFNHVVFDGCGELSYYTFQAKLLGLVDLEIEFVEFPEHFPVATRDDLERLFLQQRILEFLEDQKRVFVKRAKPTVSVCIPHRNRPSCLEVALKSLSGQTVLPDEVVVVDDGSEREHRSSVEELAKGSWPFDLRLSLRSHEGARVARNWAAEMARGEVLIFLDDDNYFLPKAIETFLAAYENSEAQILVSPFLREFISDPTETLSPGGVVTERVWLPLGPSPSLGIIQNVLGDMNALFQRDYFWELGGLNTAHNLACEDWELLGQAMMSGGHINVIPEILMVYRDHQGSFLKRAPRILSEMGTLKPYMENLDLRTNLYFEIARSFLAKESAK